MRTVVILNLILLCSTVRAEQICIEFEACVTADFSSGPCVGLNNVGELVTGRICYDDAVPDTDPFTGEGTFVNAITSFEFSVGSVMGSVDVSNFVINTTDSDSLSGDEKVLFTLLNPSTMQVPAGMDITLNALFFQLFNSGASVFADPDALSGITGIYDQFDSSQLSRFQVVGECADPTDPSITGRYGFEAEVKRVSIVPEPSAAVLMMLGVLAIVKLRRS